MILDAYLLKVYNNDRPAYYAAINIGKKYETRRRFYSWLEYFVNGFKEEIDQVRHHTLRYQ